MSEYLVQSYLDHVQQLFPDKTAVSCNGSRMTYDELFRASNQLANCLISNGVSRQDRVVICLARSINSIMSMIGILKADAIYVPIDSKSPLKRWRKIIEDCRPTFLICDVDTVDNMLQIISDIPNTPKMILMEDSRNQSKGVVESVIFQNQMRQQDSAKPEYKNIDTDIAYILYTSGSTGDPKGVMISHLNIQNYIQWAVECIGITQDDNILSTAPFHFDMSVFDIYCAIKAGATLCIVPESFLLFPGKLVDFIEEEEITVWKGISALLMYLAKTRSIEHGRMPSLKNILFGGEVLPTKYVIEWMKMYPDKRFYNVYGPTEATGISTYHLIEKIPKDHRESIPIGKACQNTEVILLKEDNITAATGEIGELCIKGSGLSRGYWNDTEKTERTFVSNPCTQIIGDRIYRTGDLARLMPDGVYEFVGRKDHQIKHMGYRIELFDIEKAILSINGVNDTVVVLLNSQYFELPELVAFTELSNGLTPPHVTKELSKKLPRYMLPQRIVPIDRIPRTERGKADRKALQQYHSNR